MRPYNTCPPPPESIACPIAPAQEGIQKHLAAQSTDNEKLTGTLEKLRPALKLIAYEAGPTGYSLARELQKAKLPVQVVAPSKTPRQSARDSKTDRLDCRKLAEYAAKLWKWALDS